MSERAMVRDAHRIARVMHRAAICARPDTKWDFCPSDLDLAMKIALLDPRRRKDLAAILQQDEFHLEQE